jgi:hypothetical protein
MSAHLEDLRKLQGYSVIAAKVGRNLLLSHNSDRKEPIKRIVSPSMNISQSVIQCKLESSMTQS